MFQFELTHRGEGYGFSVLGPHPLRVGRIRPGGPAEEAGLRNNDVITRINNKLVVDKDFMSVAAMIRYSRF